MEQFVERLQNVLQSDTDLLTRYKNEFECDVNDNSRRPLDYILSREIVKFELLINYIKNLQQYIVLSTGKQVTFHEALTEIMSSGKKAYRIENVPNTIENELVYMTNTKEFGLSLVVGNIVGKFYPKDSDYDSMWVVVA